MSIEIFTFREVVIFLLAKLKPLNAIFRSSESRRLDSTSHFEMTMGLDSTYRCIISVHNQNSR